MSQQIFLYHTYLKFKVDTDMAIPRNHMETFDFMVDHLIDSLYE